MGNDSEPGSSVEGVEVRKESFFAQHCQWLDSVCLCVHLCVSVKVLAFLLLSGQLVTKIFF